MTTCAFFEHGRCRQAERCVFAHVKDDEPPRNLLDGSIYSTAGLPSMKGTSKPLTKLPSVARIINLPHGNAGAVSCILSRLGIHLGTESIRIQHQVSIDDVQVKGTYAEIISAGGEQFAQELYEAFRKGNVKTLHGYHNVDVIVLQ
ncbi:Putative Zinc finger, CCCH-type [Colletotrichum destructivum]|uniref:Zinc finger, CCCH-type n=1 Tax=Colletotrichum destructivum TaxID=34406 RepID=A0AAX4J4V9_9PEZI|nr:Putative Zinc finger, CCCH-type [Colletotrichum destructivum]